MKTVIELEAVDFLNYCLSFSAQVAEGNNNYTHTHNQVRWDNKTGRLSYEEVCVNSEGSHYGLGNYYEVLIPKEWEHLLPFELRNEPHWTFVEV